MVTAMKKLIIAIAIVLILFALQMYAGERKPDAIVRYEDKVLALYGMHGKGIYIKVYKDNEYIETRYFLLDRIERDGKIIRPNR